MADQEKEKGSCPECGYPAEAGHSPACPAGAGKSENQVPEAGEKEADSQEQYADFSEVADLFAAMSTGDTQRVTLANGREVLLVVEKKLVSIVEEVGGEKIVSRFYPNGTEFDRKSFQTSDELRWARLKRRER
ncbi:MAG: hypothetical protein WC505_00615 [Patescibacteria group bacterium]